MMPTFQLDTRQFDATLARYMETSKKTVAEIVNQKTSFVAREAFKLIPPLSISAQKSRNLAWLRAGTYVTSQQGKNTRGQVRPRQYIIASARRRAGQAAAGGYRQQIEKITGKMTARATQFLGSLKSALIPIIVGLNPHVKYKAPVSLTRHIQRWPGSKGSGTVDPARPGDNVFAQFRIAFETVRPLLGVDREGYCLRLYTRAVQDAIDKEQRSMADYVYQRMQEDANRVNAR